MVTPFIIDDEYTLVFNNKTKKLDSIFYHDIKNEDTTEYFNDWLELYTFCLKKCWLTNEEPDYYIYDIFKKYMNITEHKWFNLKQFERTLSKDKFFELVDFIYNL